MRYIRRELECRTFSCVTFDHFAVAIILYILRVYYIAEHERLGEKEKRQPKCGLEPEQIPGEKAVPLRPNPD